MTPASVQRLTIASFPIVCSVRTFETFRPWPEGAVSAPDPESVIPDHQRPYLLPPKAAMRFQDRALATLMAGAGWKGDVSYWL
jgi:hypothetical protein